MTRISRACANHQTSHFLARPDYFGTCTVRTLVRWPHAKLSHAGERAWPRPAPTGGGGGGAAHLPYDGARAATDFRRV
eukprot:3478495-Prymnesium_polylepis.1